MAYDSARKSLKLHISRRREDSYDTLGWVGDILSVLEYTYNVAAVFTLLRQSYNYDRVPEIAQILERADEFGFAGINYSLRTYIPLEAQARLLLLQIVDSVEIGFDGLGDAIDALAKVIDPLHRRAKKEDNRHTQEMNLLHEQEKKADLDTKEKNNQHKQTMDRLEEEDRKTQVVRARLQLLRELEQQVGPSDELTKQIASYVMKELMRGGDALDRNEIRIIEGTA